MKFEFENFLIFASEAEQLALLGMLCWMIAAIALLADRRRQARKQVDKIGWVPWTGLFLCFAVLGGGLIFMAMPSILGSN